MVPGPAGLQHGRDGLHAPVVIEVLEEALSLTVRTVLHDGGAHLAGVSPLDLVGSGDERLLVGSHWAHLGGHAHESNEENS